MNQGSMLQIKEACCKSSETAVAECRVCLFLKDIGDIESERSESVLSLIVNAQVYEVVEH